VKRQIALVGILVFTCAQSVIAGNERQESYVNSVGMRLIRIDPGSFIMGTAEKIPADAVRADKPGWRVGEPRTPALWEGVRKGLVGAVLSRDVSESRTQKVIDQLNVDWSTPEAKQQELSGKSARWRGLVKAPVTGPVTFTIEANSDVRVSVNHELVIDVDSKSQMRTAQVQMTKGRLTSIAIDTEQTSYTRLYWSWPGQKKVLVPAKAFWHSAADYNMTQAFLSWVPGRKSRGTGNEKVKGDFDETPSHKVTITRPFYMSETEVTIDQFRQFKAEYPGYDKFRPYASAISWHDAAAFCKWLSKKEGKPYRLPTEAEWEYACRAGSTAPFSSGNRIPEHETANCCGLKNMHTGVREWCLDSR
jgi:hypothetical protein